MRVLLVENQKQFGQLLYQRLRTQLDVDWIEDIPNLHTKLVERFYPLLILGMDVSIEDRLSLVEQCHQISARSAIMLVSESMQVHERIHALEQGADDCLTRPFHLDEFAARAKALLRRADASHFDRLRVGNIELSDEGDLLLNGVRADLQNAEHRLLSILVRRSGRMVSKAMIDHALTGQQGDELSANAIEQRVSRLRKILSHARADVQITTVRGSGYVLETITEKNRDHLPRQTIETRRKD